MCNLCTTLENSNYSEPLIVHILYCFLYLLLLILTENMFMMMDKLKVSMYFISKYGLTKDIIIIINDL